jgi:hypothetical protein
MSLYFIFTIDGDWDEYFNTRLSPEERKPDEKRLLTLIDEEIELASSTLNGRFLHFIHTSPLVRDFFLRPRFVDKWREIARKGGSLGIHCHEEELYSAWYFDDAKRMGKAITFMANGLRKNGLLTMAYRGGYMTFSPRIIPVLEKKDILLGRSWYRIGGGPRAIITECRIRTIASRAGATSLRFLWASILKSNPSGRSGGWSAASSRKEKNRFCRCWHTPMILNPGPGFSRSNWRFQF